MNTRTKGLAALALTTMLALTGCSSAGEAEPTATPTPTPTYATTAQVASVIAGYEQDWRDVYDRATACRVALVTNPEGIEAVTCSFTEQTAGLNAFLAARDIRALAVPPELDSLVASTLPVLDQMAATDFDSSCLVDGTFTDSEACTTFLGQRFAYYLQLDGELDKWGPYL